MAEEHAPVAKLGKREFVIKRAFSARRERMFKAWTDSKLLAQWWGPRTFTTPVCDLDVRPGGAYRIVMRSPEGVDYPIKGDSIQQTFDRLEAELARMQTVERSAAA